jgi:hypothetical protein
MDTDNPLNDSLERFHRCCSGAEGGFLTFGEALAKEPVEPHQ